MPDTPIEPMYELADLQKIEPGTRIKITLSDDDAVREDFRGKVLDCEFRQLDLAPEYRAEATGKEFEDSRYWIVVADPSPGSLDPFANNIKGAHPKSLIFAIHAWLIEDIEPV